MGNRIDMLGQRYGKFTVLESAGSTKHGAALWKCQCVCGTIKMVRGGSLRNGAVRSCGCLHPRLELTGKQYGKLLVKKLQDTRGNRGQILWECLCEYGNIALIPTANLRSGNSKSCGCVRKYTGEKSVRWDFTISAEDRRRSRNEKKAKTWREYVYSRDDYICQKCQQRGGDLQAHHVVPYAKDESLAYILSNGITLCLKCHRAFHRLHGNRYSKQVFFEWRDLPVGAIA
jgi:hypothetical protein